MDEAELNRRLCNIEKNIEKILTALNGKEGIITKTALVEQRVNDIPSPTSLKWYAGIGGGAVTCVGLVLFLIIHSIKSLWGN